MGVENPLARDFYRAIERAPTDRPARGWQRLTDVATLAPGDLFAWLKPEMFKQRANTGHVGFAQNENAVQATGDANLGILQGFYRDLRSRGTAQLRAEITGTLD